MQTYIHIKIYIERAQLYFYRPYTYLYASGLNYIAFYSLFQEATLTSEQNRC